ncbi:DUF4422 domain-containing protein [Pectinatus frisingensis]|uniref:DUF4422 domain-containing protein n=1 Tax=Pectinatus frisingensis TaxID=865 RepID=UPI0018C4D12A|nr:DUF4422 domain-containing protein [Pectinatus frisingensis]
MADIKIFISNRIDINSTQINNSLYVPVRCGAVYDKRKNISILGDNTGDNISAKRNSFCEFTVQYWAWKNIDADYYGLCHYRRFLTFSKKIFKSNNQKQIMEYFLDKNAIQKYDLLNEKGMRKCIEKNDVIVNEIADVKYIPTPKGFINTVYEHWSAHDGMFINKNVLPILLKTIRQLCPEYFQAANEYLNGKWHRGYNCYVMKKVYFQRMNEFQFTILFDLEKKLKNSKYLDGLERTMGYLGEILYGIYIHYLLTKKDVKIVEKQLVYFNQTEVPKNMVKKYLQKILIFFKINFENIGFILLPKASKRRKIIKKIYFKLMK